MQVLVKKHFKKTLKGFKQKTAQQFRLKHK